MAIYPRPIHDQNLDIVHIKEGAFALTCMFSVPPSSVLVEDVRVNGYNQPIPVRSFRPGGASASQVPIVLYLHGGLFTGGSVDDANDVCEVLTTQLPAWVISVGYSLAPQHPFPSAPEDAYKALQWAISEASSVRADKTRIAVIGHDAGGNIAAAVSAIARDRNSPVIRAQVLFAPLLDPSLTRFVQSHDSHAIRMDALDDAYRAYLPTFTQRVHPYAAPLESRRLTDLPPAFIASVDDDPLRGEAERYAGMLIAAGIPTESIRYTATSRDAIPAHEPALTGAIDFLKRYLA